MYTYSDFTVLIALNYMNKAQTEKHTKKKQNKKKPQENREKRQDSVLSTFVCNNCSRYCQVGIGF